MLCGKIAAGKSTLADRLAEAPATVLIREDHWNACLFKDKMRTVEDYVRCSRRLRAAMGPHVVALLKAGLSVVLDFQANTVATRQDQPCETARPRTGTLLPAEPHQVQDDERFAPRFRAGYFRGSPMMVHLP
jgi:predicted kinase